jgi:hypothetical protein
VSGSPRITDMRSGTDRRNVWFAHMNFASSMTGVPGQTATRSGRWERGAPSCLPRSSRPPLTDARQFDILRSSPTRLGAHELHRLQRRDLITLLAGTTVLSPFTARAQQQDRMRRVGVIMGFAEDDEVWQAYLATFRQRLQDFGWTDGRNIRFHYRFTGESTERMRIAAAEMVVRPATGPADAPTSIKPWPSGSMPGGSIQRFRRPFPGSSSTRSGSTAARAASMFATAIVSMIPVAARTRIAECA